MRLEHGALPYRLEVTRPQGQRDGGWAPLEQGLGRARGRPPHPEHAPRRREILELASVRVVDDERYVQQVADLPERPMGPSVRRQQEGVVLRGEGEDAVHSAP